MFILDLRHSGTIKARPPLGHPLSTISEDFTAPFPITFAFSIFLESFLRFFTKEKVFLYPNDVVDVTIATDDFIYHLEGVG